MLGLLILIAVLVGIVLVYRKQVALEERLDAQSRDSRDSDDLPRSNKNDKWK